MKRSGHPVSYRVNDDDWAVMKWLQEKLGLGPTQVIRLALRRLYELEKGPKK